MRIAAAVLASVLGAGLLCAQAPPERAQDEAAIRGLVKKYLAAREERNPKGVEALFTEDADQLVSSGTWRRGRDTIVKGTLASSDNNPGDRTITIDNIRFLSPDVAIADGPYTIANEQQERNMRATFLMKRLGDGWKIAAIRNMLPAPRNR